MLAEAVCSVVLVGGYPVMVLRIYLYGSAAGHADLQQQI